MSSLFYSFYVFQKRAELKKESVEIKKDTIVYKKGRKLFVPNQDNIVNDDVSIDSDDTNDIVEKEYLNNKDEYVAYSNDQVNNIEYCNQTDLSPQYDYTIFVKRNVNEEIDELLVQIRNKTTKEILEKNISLVDIDGVKNYYYKSTFTNCNLVRSFLTGHNINKRPYDLDEGDFIVGDFNFDNIEDFAIKIDSGNNSGPSYGFYIKQGIGYKLDRFLTKEVRFLPEELNNVNNTITTNIIIGCCSTRERVYQYISRNKRWVILSSEDKNMN